VSSSLLSRNKPETRGSFGSSHGYITQTAYLLRHLSRPEKILIVIYATNKVAFLLNWHLLLVSFA